MRLLVVMEGERSTVLLRNTQGWQGGHFDSLRASSQFCDVTLLCEDGTSFPAHKVILSSHWSSSYISALSLVESFSVLK